MTKIDICDTQRNNLIAAALGLQQCTGTDGTEVLIPGGDKRILIGGPAYLARVAAPASADNPSTACADPVAALTPDGRAVKWNPNFTEELWVKKGYRPLYLAAPVAQSTAENVRDAALEEAKWRFANILERGPSAPTRNDALKGIAAIDACKTTRTAPVAQSTVGAAEPERMSTDESREYLVKFTEQHFTDKTFHRYIRNDQGNRQGLAGDFAWQLARTLRMILAAPALNPSEVRQQARDKDAEQIADLDPKNGSIATAVFMAREGLATATSAGEADTTASVSGEQEAIAAEMQRLHNALCFWLPQNHAKLPDAMQQRIAADAYLLVGYDDMPDKQTAEELGWVAAQPSPVSQAVEQPADDAEDARRLSKFIDWYLASKRFADIDPWGHVRVTTREHILNWLDGGSNDLPGMSATKQEGGHVD